MICFSFGGRTQIIQNEEKWNQQLRQSNFGGEVGGVYAQILIKFTSFLYF